MKRSPRFLAFLLACLCLMLPAAGHGGVTVTPLEDQEDFSYFEYYFPEPDVSLVLPLDCQIEHLLDNARQQAIRIGLPGFPDADFIFFAFKHEELKGKSLGDMGPEEIAGVLDMISSHPKNITCSPPRELLPGVFVLRAGESSYGAYADHLLAIRGEWLLNMMASGPDDPLSEETVAKQEEMLQNALAPEDMWKHLQTYTLPGAEMSLSAPDSMYLRVMAEDPEFVHVSLCPKSPGAQLSVVQVFAAWDAAYEKQTALTLTGDVKSQALGMPSPGGTFDENSLAELPGFAGDIPALSYESGDDFSHLMALKDGWALYASVLPYAEFIHPDWVEALRQAALRQLLDGRTPLPGWLPGTTVTREGNVLRFPLATRVLTVRIPEGYGVDVDQDNADGRSVFLYALDGSGKYFSIQSSAFPVITAELTLTQAYSREDLQKLCDGATESINEYGLTASSAIAEGPLGLPAVHTTTGELAHERYSWMMDSHTLSVAFFSEETPITKEESALLKGLLALE